MREGVAEGEDMADRQQLFRAANDRCGPLLPPYTSFSQPPFHATRIPLGGHTPGAGRSGCRQDRSGEPMEVRVARLHGVGVDHGAVLRRSEEHTSEIKSLMRSSYA